nr:PD40 domain-containing protein [Acidobacteriota bacterium]
PKVIETLLALVERSGEVLSKDELMEIVWADSTVEESNLSQNLYLLRKTLGKKSGGEPLIETLRRRGYRFNGDVQCIEVSEVETAENHLLGETQSAESDISNNHHFSVERRGNVVALADWKETETYSTKSVPEELSKNSATIKVEEHSVQSEIIEPETGTHAVPEVKSKTNKAAWLLTAICGTILLSGAFFLWQKWRNDSGFEKIELKALTTSGNIRDSAISPDGKLFAYAKNENGKQSLWIRQTQLRESEIRLTEPTAEASFVGLSFTPDGNKIYFLFGPKNNSIKQLYAISILGGQPTVILDDVDSPPAFAPDGRRLTFMRGNSKTGISTLFIANVDGSALRELTERAPPLNFRLRPLAWLPDGKKIVCVVYDRTLLFSLKIVEIDVETGAENAIGNQLWSEIEAIAWTKDSAGLIFTASEPQKPLYSQIWFLPYPNGAARRLTNDLVNYGNLSVARDSGEIIVRQQQTENQVWLIDTKSPAAPPRRITSNNSDGEHGLVWTPDNRLIYSSVINGSNSLQKMSIQDSSQASLTTGEYVFSQPCTTSDGRYIVYVSTQAQHYNLWRINADGKDAKQLSAVNVEHPTCSPDGRRIFYTAVNDGRRSLWEISIDGGEPRMISEKIIFFPQISPDATRIACFFRAAAKTAWQIAILPTGEDRILQTFNLPETVALSSPFVWSKDGDALILIETREGVSNLWRYALDGQTPTQLTNFADESLPIINNFAVSPDGLQIALTRARKISDIVQIVGTDSPTVR